MHRQVHREEGHVRAGVAEAEAVVELDAVDDREAARLEVDVLKPQVTVAVADATCLDARLEHPLVGAQELELTTLQLSRFLCRRERYELLAGLVEVLLHVGGDGLAGPEARRRAIAACALVEAREPVGDLLDLAALERASCEERVRAHRVRQASHVHRPLHDVPGAPEAKPRRVGATAAAAHHGHDAAVHVHREPTVQAQPRPRRRAAAPRGS